MDFSYLNSLMPPIVVSIYCYICLTVHIFWALFRALIDM